MSISSLTETLAVQTVLLEELLRLLEQETGVLGEMNLEQMEEMDRSKERSAERTEKQSAVLRREIEAAAAALGLPENTGLGAVVAAAGRQELTVAYDLMTVAVQRVQERAGINREIAERFSETAATTLNLLARMINQSSVYGASGSYQQHAAGAVMINREA